MLELDINILGFDRTHLEFWIKTMTMILINLPAKRWSSGLSTRDRLWNLAFSSSWKDSQSIYLPKYRKITISNVITAREYATGFFQSSTIWRHSQDGWQSNGRIPAIDSKVGRCEVCNIPLAIIINLSHKYLAIHRNISTMKLHIQWIVFQLARWTWPTRGRGCHRI